MPRTPTQTPRSPAETPTILPRSDGIGIGLPITLWLLRPTETRVESRWTPTQSRPESDAAAAGSAPTRGRYGARAPDSRSVASRSLRARSTHTSPPATTTAFGRLPTLIVRATRPATAGTWSPAGDVVAVVGVLERRRGAAPAAGQGERRDDRERDDRNRGERPDPGRAAAGAARPGVGEHGRRLVGRRGGLGLRRRRRAARDEAVAPRRVVAADRRERGAPEVARRLVAVVGVLGERALDHASSAGGDVRGVSRAAAAGRCRWAQSVASSESRW